MIQNGIVWYPGPPLLLFIFRFEYLITGPKSYRDFRETGPWKSGEEGRSMACACYYFCRLIDPTEHFIVNKSQF